MQRTTASVLAIALAGSIAANALAFDGANSDIALSPETVGGQGRAALYSSRSLGVSGLFDAEGGTLTATSADGTQFILTVPRNATAVPIDITMTPVVGGRAVEIEPNGAFLWLPADLKIVPPTAPDLKSLSYFRYGAPDGNFTPYPGVVGSTGIEMSISYLTSYGFWPDAMFGLSSERPVRAKSADPRFVRALRAGSPSLAPYIARVAADFKQLLNEEIDSPTYQQEVYGIWDEAWTNVVSPALQSLGTDCDPDTIAPVIQLAFEFLHLASQSAPGYDDSPGYEAYNNEVYAIAKAVVLNCIDVHYQLCKSQNDPTQVQLMVQLIQLLQTASLLSDDEAAEVNNKISKCLHFELDFESALTIPATGEGYTYTDYMKVRAVVPIQIESVDYGIYVKTLLRGNAPISHELIDIEGPPCTYAPMTKPDTFVVDLLSISLFKEIAPPKPPPGEEPGPAPQVPATRNEIRISVVFFTGDPEEAFAQTCPAGSAGPITINYPFDSKFETFYATLHRDEALPGGGFEIRTKPPWEVIRSGNFFAKADYVRTVSLPRLGPVSEETHIFLKHTPQ